MFLFMNTRKTRIVFVGTSTWELTSIHLEYFLKHHANIVAYVESPTDNIVSTTAGGGDRKNIHDVAVASGLPLKCPATPRDPEFLAWLKEVAPDVVIVCGYQFYLPKAFLDIPPMGVINFHTSLLPRHCGRHPGFQTIWYGDKESGMTLHFMDAGLDTGDIISQNRIPVEPDDTVDSLYSRIWAACEPLVENLLNDLDNNSVPRVPQDPSQYFYNYELDECDYELDFRQTARLLKNRVSMMPGKFYFTIDGQKYYVEACSLVEEPSHTRNFRLRTPYLANQKIVFATPKQFLQIDSIQHQGNTVAPTQVIATDAMKKIA